MGEQGEYRVKWVTIIAVSALYSLALAAGVLYVAVGVINYFSL